MTEVASSRGRALRSAARRAAGAELHPRHAGHAKHDPVRRAVEGDAPARGRARVDGAEDGEELPEVWGEADGLRFAASEPYTLLVHGPNRGRGEAFFDGALDDHFELRFRPASEIVLVDLVGEELDAIAFAPGGETAVGVKVLDRWSRPLGYRADDLVVEADGGLSAWPEDGYLHLVADDAGGLRVDVLDAEIFTEVSIGEAHSSEIVPIHEEHDHIVLLHRAWTAEGTRVFGAPVEWPVGAEQVGPDLAMLATQPQ